MFCECRLSDIIKEQYHIAKNLHIPLSDSECISIFEKDAYIELILQDLKRERDSMSNQPT